MELCGASQAHEPALTALLAPLSDDTLAPTHVDLRALLPQIASLADELASFGIGATIDHDDLHDANVLVRDGNAVVFDWSDACVTQPWRAWWTRTWSPGPRSHRSSPCVARPRSGLAWAA